MEVKLQDEFILAGPPRQLEVSTLDGRQYEEGVQNHEWQCPLSQPIYYV